MSKQARYRFGVLAAVILSATVSGCSNQGEGERCDLGNGNLDCQSGLLCRQITNQSYSLCCPPADQTPSAAACSNVGGGAVAPVDASAAASEAATSSPETGVSEASSANDEDSASDAEGNDAADAGSAP